jgi:LytS/YehU family sensor histidine kinase
MNLGQEQLQLLIPPLTLQMIIENIVTHNSLSKSAPLVISIHSAEDNWVEVRNNTQPRVGSDTSGLDESMDNIINKIHLLCRNEVSIHNTATERIIQIPLITCREEVSA